MSRSLEITAAINRARREIDQLFIEAVGPFGEHVAEDCFGLWLQRRKSEDESLKFYVVLLAREIPSLQGKKDFATKAVKFINVA